MRQPSAVATVLRSAFRLIPGAALIASILYASQAHVQEREGGVLLAGALESASVFAILTPGALAAIVCLIALSAFFSACEAAFFGIHQLRLREMRESGTPSQRLVGDMMSHPGRLLTTILVGNMIANVVVCALLPNRLAAVFSEVAGYPPAAAVSLAALVSLALLVFLGEVAPKVIAVRVSEIFAVAAALPMRAIDAVLYPVCWVLLRFTEALFRLTRFDEITAAPFITDAEFIGLLNRGETQGVLEAQEGQMIQGILELGDAMLREILVPRPDVIAVPGSATVGEALELFRQHEYSRMPVFEENLDHVVGVLVAKDLLPMASQGRLEDPITPAMRRPRFVPDTMTIQAFVKYAQRARTHLAVVVDEYGGTEGIVTLEDAVEEVVGKIHDESELEEILHRKIGENTYRVDGTMPLDELSELIGVRIEDEEHETVAGFVMAQASKILEKGDHVAYNGAEFLVEAVDGRRVARLRVHVDPAVKDADV